jgi:flagellar hook-basal body complex protein FliE
MDPLTATAFNRALASLPSSEALQESGVPARIPPAEIANIPTLSARTSEPVSFEGVLGRMVEEVNSRQLAAADQVQGLLSGQNVSLHETMIAMEEASLSFQLMVEVRNKLLESYQELMRMQV